jgi:hypothetical protein
MIQDDSELIEASITAQKQGEEADKVDLITNEFKTAF